MGFTISRTICFVPSADRKHSFRSGQEIFETGEDERNEDSQRRVRFEMLFSGLFCRKERRYVRGTERGRVI